jgi:hypothetical protein
MDPLTILSILGGLLRCVQGAFDAIEKAQQAEEAEIEALKNLKAAMSSVEGEISFIKIMISTLQSSENEPVYSAFIEKYASAYRFRTERHYG